MNWRDIYWTLAECEAKELLSDGELAKLSVWN
jgi:hypothetical protein